VLREAEVNYGPVFDPENRSIELQNTLYWDISC